MKNALILGAGMVSKPIVDYLVDSKNVFVVMASRTVEKAQNILKQRENTRAVSLLVDNDLDLEKLIKAADIVISLLPYTYHVKTAKYCLKYKIPMVTTSYVSKAMKELDQEARDNDILILNEIGLDPGIDHMSAMRIIHNVRKQGGYVRSFRSYCGGLPAPEANNNPWGYKFSWSPRAVLMAGRNDALYLKQGDRIEIPGKDLFEHNWPINIADMAFETYPNRDSLPYIELYGISRTDTMFRGTLRYPGWCRTLLAISRLHLLTDNEIPGTKGLDHRSIMQKIWGLSGSDDPVAYLVDKLNLSADDEIIEKLRWLGLFESDTFGKDTTTPMDFLAERMLAKMPYEKGERDMIVLYHDFLAEYPHQQERITSTLVDYGIPNGDSSMSRTVSLPAAIATRLILEGKIKETGVRIPV
ncbi:MAG: saccharopine dehydrogenase NADP-binding domain-containing protein, partial [bacterium]